MRRKRTTPRQDATGVHVWLVFMKAFQALLPHAAESIERTDLGDSDFRVLEVLLHKGPLPVNTIGPKVYLTPGSISVAVDRLVDKGLVSRVERFFRSIRRRSKPSRFVDVGNRGILTSTRPGRFRSTSMRSGRLEASIQMTLPRL